MSSNPDYLAKAARLLLRPALESHGFQQYSPKTYVRLCGKIAQFLDLQKSAYGGGRFAVNYFVFVLVPPREFIGSILAGRFPRHMSNDGWWNSNTQDSAEDSIRIVKDTFDSFALPIVTSTSTLLGYVECLLERPGGNGHRNADVGCALALAGDLSNAYRHLQEARNEYSQMGFDWSIAAEKRMAELLAAIDTNSHGKLLNNWCVQSMTNLKLDKKWKAK